MAEKKIAAAPLSERLTWIAASADAPSLSRQFDLTGVPRSSYYYQPVRTSEENMLLMRLIDRQYTATPFYGARRLHAWLVRQGYAVNVKRVRKLMRAMGLQALGPKPRLTAPGASAERFPYLLRNRVITDCNDVWSTDITYIPMARGYLYLVAVMDWHSRYVLSWELSNSLETGFCLAALEAALSRWGRPLIFNSDQGVQFTSRTFTERLQNQGIAISRDGAGRATDNAFVERLWRSVKYECVYLRSFDDGLDVHQALDAYFRFYNHERLHQGLGYRCPAEIYLENFSADEKKKYKPIVSNS